MKPGINLPQGTPTVLDGWARLVQMKVEKFWQIPAGMRVGGAENEAVVTFTVDRQGNLIEKPQVVKEADDPELGESGARAIELAAPLPPLPEDLKAFEQEVIYVFTLVE
jgi:TonB family protein